MKHGAKNIFMKNTKEKKIKTKKQINSKIENQEIPDQIKKQIDDNISPEVFKMVKRLDRLDDFIQEMRNDEFGDFSTINAVEMMITKARHIAFQYCNDSDPYRSIGILIKMITFCAEETFAVTKAQTKADDEKKEK